MVNWLMRSIADESRVLVIGIGNPLRGDDGFGWAVIDHLSQTAQSDTVTLCAVHQLTPELAESLCNASLAIFVDASVEGTPGDLRSYPITPSETLSSVGSHHYDPSELLTLTKTFYDYCPPAIAIAATAIDFPLSETLSPTLAAQVPVACEMIQELISKSKP
jgi:hydrogenase maturation protease